MSTSTGLALGDLRAAMSSINQLFDAEVCGKRNFDAIDDIYTEDARILPPGVPMISGRAAIKEFWAGMVTSMNALSGVLEPVDVITAGDGVVEIGKAKLTAAPEGQTVEMEMKYVVYWRQEAGRWKWHVDIWNPNS